MLEPVVLKDTRVNSGDWQTEHLRLGDTAVQEREQWAELGILLVCLAVGRGED